MVYSELKLSVLIKNIYDTSTGSFQLLRINLSKISEKNLILDKCPSFRSWDTLCLQGVFLHYMTSSACHFSYVKQGDNETSLSMAYEEFLMENIHQKLKRKHIYEKHAVLMQLILKY